LSVRAVLPRMVTMEQKHGSLSRAMLAARKSAPKPGRSAAPARSLFTTLRDGMSQMTDGIAAQLIPGSVHLSSPVESVTRQNDSWLVETAFGRERYDALILALPAWTAGGLLRPTHRTLGEALQGVPYSSSITVTLGYQRDDLCNLPLGFGYLVPTSENRRMLACTFVHNKFAGRTPADKGVLRCFLGGSGNDALLDQTDADLTAIVEQELAEVLDLRAKPNFVRIARWRQSMAQYGVGHLERMQRVREAVASLPGLALAGNAYEGIGVPDCIRTGQQAAESALKSLQQREAAPISEAAS
ncbi:MAG: protoporphyrinogen oxidase, partial [Acidobacteriaceae bacterium]